MFVSSFFNFCFPFFFFLYFVCLFLLFSLLPLPALLCAVIRQAIVISPTASRPVVASLRPPPLKGPVSALQGHFPLPWCKQTQGRCSQLVGKGAGCPLVQPPRGEPASAGAVLSTAGSQTPTVPGSCRDTGVGSWDSWMRQGSEYLAFRGTLFPLSLY